MPQMTAEPIMYAVFCQGQEEMGRKRYFTIAKTGMPVVGLVIKNSDVSQAISKYCL